MKLEKEVKKRPPFQGGENVRIGQKVILEKDVILGNNVTIYDHVTIKKGALIGDNVIIGYREFKASEKSPADIADLLVEIGENVKIRSGTVIYWGTRIGNNSSVGHNAVIREKTIIGHDTYIGSLTSVEGDTKIGNYAGIQTRGSGKRKSGNPISRGLVPVNSFAGGNFDKQVCPAFDQVVPDVLLLFSYLGTKSSYYG